MQSLRGRRKDPRLRKRRFGIRCRAYRRRADERLSSSPSHERRNKKKFEKTLGEEAEFFSKNLQCGIPAIALDSQHALFTAYTNDVDADFVYAQQVFGYARPNDLFIGISTSGNSKNVVNAAKTAKALGISTVALTGAKESCLSEICDCTIRVPETETFMVQELHLPVYHYLCAEMEERIYGK